MDSRARVPILHCKSALAWARRRFSVFLICFLYCLVGTSHSAESPLATAAEQSDAKAVRALLDQGADVNASQPDGMTALHWTAYHDNLELAQTLVEARAAVSVTNRYGVTPLALACQNGNGALVELLLAHGADPNTPLPGGETALMTAARTGRLGPVLALLKKGADVNARERRGQTPLMWAAAEGHAQVVSALIDAGADVNASVTDSSFTALFFAAREGQSDVVRVLLKAGVDVNGTMDPKRTIAKGPTKGTSALILAVENGHFDLALSLVKAGADPNDQRSGFAPLHVMTWVRKPNRGEDDGAPPPQGSGTLSSLQFIRKLTEHGADVNLPLKTGKGGPAIYNKTGVTPFFMASGTDDVAYMRLLLELGADPHVRNTDDCTPLIAACGNVVGSDAANEKAGEEPEVLEAAELLLKLGADINAVDANGETAMHAAAYKNLPRVVQFLADHGARIDVWNRKNKYGWTPSMIAEGHRPGNFKPSAETIEAFQRLLTGRGEIPPKSASLETSIVPGAIPAPESKKATP